MDSFKVDRDAGRERSVNRTIRIRGTQFDKLMELSEHTGVSFNKIVNQCIDYALTHLEED